MDRIDRYIDREFTILENKYVSNPAIRKEISKLHRGLRDLTVKLKAEIKVKKRYDINVNFLNAEISRIDLGTIEKSYWLKGNIPVKRPPGLTNTEINELLNKIRNILNSFRNKILEKNKTFISLESLCLDLNHIIRETFILPNKNLPFTIDLYDRNPNKPHNFNQNTPCQICGENRASDICHVIPAELGGSKDSYNTIYLCPTHHRLFDRHMLSKDEWEKLDFNQVCLASGNFARYVLKPQMEKFWNKLKNSDYEKNTVSYLLESDLIKSYKITIKEVLAKHGDLNLNEIMQKTKISRGYCIKILNKAIKEKSIDKKVKKGKTIYSKK